MSTKSNGEIASSFLIAAIAGQPAYEAVGPDATWWIPGGRPPMPLTPFLEGLTKIFPAGGKLAITGVTEQGDRVALEAASTVDLGDGRVYTNEYHFLVVLSEGKVVSVKEYCDTARVHEFFGG